MGTAETVLLAIQTQKKHGVSPFTETRMRTGDGQDARRQRGLEQLPPPAAGSEVDDDTPLKRSGKVPRAVGRALLKAVAEPAEEDEEEAKKGTLPGAIKFEAAGNKPDADDRQEDLAKLEAASAKLDTAHDILYGVKTVLPKTSETVGLLERSLYDMADLPDELMGQRGNQAEAQREIVETIRSRSVWWVVGTSLGFEALVLCCAAWIFCRRDY